MTIEGAVNTYNVLKENDFKITGESLLSAGTTLLSAAATVAGFKALGSSVRETTALIRSGAACFTAGTLVLTENGQKAIEDIQAGDKVYATNPETGESGYKEVLQTFEKETEVVVHVTYEKDGEGSNAETTTVNTTLNHRFWTEDGWKSAGTLEAGDKLTLADGNTATVTNVAYEDTHATVYNFEVEDFHTYYVGTESVLVHNNGGNCMKTASALAQGGSKGGSTSGYRVNDSRRNHILEGEGPTDPGHGPNRGFTEGAFPDTWTDEQVISAIEDVANNPNSTWKQSTGPGAGNAPITVGTPDVNAPSMTNKGTPVRFMVKGRNHGLNITVIVEPHGEGIITGYNSGR